jgi:hypothetical protein
MIKLIILKEKIGTTTTKKSSVSSAKVLDLFFWYWHWYSGLCGDECCPPCQTAGVGETVKEFLFFPCFPWSYGPCDTSRSSEVVLSDSWLVSSIWFLLSTGQVAIRTCGCSLPVCVRWSNLLFSPACSCVALPLQLCLVSSSPSKVGQLSFEYHPQSHETSSVIHHAPCFGRLACHPTPAPSACS